MLRRHPLRLPVPPFPLPAVLRAAGNIAGTALSNITGYPWFGSSGDSGVGPWGTDGSPFGGPFVLDRFGRVIVHKGTIAIAAKQVDPGNRYTA